MTQLTPPIRSVPTAILSPVPIDAVADPVGAMLKTFATEVPVTKDFH